MKETKKKQCISVYLATLILTTILSCNINKSKPSLLDDSKISVVKTEKLSISQKLVENNHLPVEERIALYHRLKNESPDAYNFENEDELTMYGYRFLWNDQVLEAIEVFKLIVEQFPNSSNPYDSLGEAYMVNGNGELSLINYEKSLELNPENFNAEDQIERLKFPDRIPETDAEKFTKIYTTKEYKEDLDQLGKKLLEVHPFALKFISKEDFWKLIEEKKALITDKTTYSEFNWYCSEIIASVNCSHTSVGGFYPENNSFPQSLRFPLQTRWVNNQLFVINPLNNENKVAIKDEILSINGIVVSEIINEIYKHTPSQGYIETSKKHDFNKWSTGLIPFALDLPESFQIIIKGVDNPVLLNAAETHKDPVNDESIKICSDNLCLEFLDNNKTAILTISSFNYYLWNNFDVFQDFIDNSFKEINKKGIENLILDLRFNGGGSPESSVYLLKYLINKPFTYFVNTVYPGAQGIHEPFDNVFKEELYYLIDGNGKSTTGHFMAMVKDLKLGTIIGEELGSNQFCTAGQTVLRLTNTKMVYHVANGAAELSVKSLPDEIGILPNHYVTQSIDDYLNNIDTVKEFTIKLIEIENNEN